MSLEILHRAALGSSASLGALYDARTDRFQSGISVFKREIPAGAREIVDASYSDVQFVHSDRISDKFTLLNIYAELQISILMGLVTLSGSGSYISNKKQSARSVRSSLVYNIRTKNEKINLYHEDLKTAYSLDALGEHTGSTHFVSEIEWGANSMLMCEYENKEDEDELEVAGKLAAQIEYAGVAIKGDASVNFTSGDTGKQISYKFRIFGDVLPDGDLPTSIESAVNLMKQVPKLVKASNSGKGKPISYKLLPISLLRDYLELKFRNSVVQPIGRSTTTRVVKFFESLEAAEQLLFDLHSDVRTYRYCLQPEEISAVFVFKGDVDNYTASMRSELSVTMRTARSGESSVESVNDFLRTQGNHEFSADNITLKLTGWSGIKRKVQFAKRVRAKGAKYLGSQGSLNEEIADLYDKKLLILYMQPDALETQPADWRENNRLFFHQILNDATEQAYFVVDCAFQPCPQNKTFSFIQVIQRGVVINQDLLADHKAFLGQPVAELLGNTTRLRDRKPSNELYPFTTHCPGKSCNQTAEYNWTCTRCGKTLQIGNDDHIYCDCGMTHIQNVSYKCSDPRHGFEFDKHEPDYIDSIITSHHKMLSGPYPRDCLQIQEASMGNASSGTYTIYPYSSSDDPNEGVQVYCDQETDGGGWTVFQRRMDTTDFYRGWWEYTVGFGNKTGSHWLGLNTLAELTKRNDTELRVDLEDWNGQKGFEVYKYFHVANNSEKFRLQVLWAGYFGNIGDSLVVHSGMAFSTKDNDNDEWDERSCAQFTHGAWWYLYCGPASNLNGLYHTSAVEGYRYVTWGSWTNYKPISLKRTEMKIRKRSFKPIN